MNRNELITYIPMQRGMKMASVLYLDKGWRSFRADAVVEIK